MRRHQAHRLPALRVQGGALPRDPPAGLRRPRPGAPLRAGDADAERPRPTDAPHGGAGGPRRPSRSCGAMRRASPQFAAYAAELRSVSVSVVRQLSELDTGDEVLDAWRSEALFGWLVETTLTWLERGDAARDDEFVTQTSAGFRALRTALTRAPLSSTCAAGAQPTATATWRTAPRGPAQMDAVATSRLGLEQRLVGLLDDVQGGERGARRPTRHTAAHRDERGRRRSGGVRDGRLEESPADPFAGDEDGVGVLAIRQEEEELLAAVAVGALPRPDHLIDARGNSRSASSPATWP